MKLTVSAAGLVNNGTIISGWDNPVKKPIAYAGDTALNNRLADTHEECVFLLFI